MHYSTIVAVFAALTSSVSAIPSSGLSTRQSDEGFPGVATFNDYPDQVLNRSQPTVCGCYDDDLANKVFAAAAGDLSPDISPGLCDYPDGKVEHRENCNDQQPKESYQGPSCSKVSTGQAPVNDKASCFKCYKVVNKDNQASVTVRIVDACPAYSAYNYCKTNTPVEGKCMSTKNALDISVKAYPFLTGKDQSTGFTGKTTNLNNLTITPLPAGEKKPGCL